MKCKCPECGRRTEMGTEVGDFPFPCDKCGALIRPPEDRGGSDKGTPHARPLRDEDKAAKVTRAQRGVLSEMLTRQPAVLASAQAPQPSVTPAVNRILTPESRRAVARVRA